jgi:hypothetical protein
MELTLKGEPEEITAFLLETGKRQDKNIATLTKIPEFQNLLGGEFDPHHLPVVVALSAREQELLKTEYVEKANRLKDDRKI